MLNTARTIGIAALREIGDRRRGLAAKLRKPGSLGGIDVEADDLKAGAAQAMHQRLTQQADADDPD